MSRYSSKWLYLDIKIQSIGRTIFLLLGPTDFLIPHSDRPMRPIMRMEPTALHFSADWFRATAHPPPCWRMV